MEDKSGNRAIVKTTSAGENHKGKGEVYFDLNFDIVAVIKQNAVDQETCAPGYGEHNICCTACSPRPGKLCFRSTKSKVIFYVSRKLQSKDGRQRHDVDGIINRKAKMGGKGTTLMV